MNISSMDDYCIKIKCDKLSHDTGDDYSIYFPTCTLVDKFTDSALYILYKPPKQCIHGEEINQMIVWDMLNADK
jgi:hypothetical protein